MRTDSLIKRFEDKVMPEPNTGCHIWTAHVNNKGYGFFNYNGKIETAHRVAYRLYKGEIPKGLWVLHACDNSYCVNPNHLWLGTSQDNVDDMMKKKRNNQARGSKSGKAKLNEELVKEIRQSSLSVMNLSRKLGIPHQTISGIRLRQRWKHIQ